MDTQSQTITFWWNYATQAYDPRTSPPTTDAEARQYIPQHAPAQSLYQIHRDLGESILTAMLAVLTLVVQAQDRAAGEG